MTADNAVAYDLVGGHGGITVRVVYFLQAKSGKADRHDRRTGLHLRGAMCELGKAIVKFLFGYNTPPGKFDHCHGNNGNIGNSIPTFTLSNGDLRHLPIATLTSRQQKTAVAFRIEHVGVRERGVSWHSLVRKLKETRASQEVVTPKLYDPGEVRCEFA